MLGHVDAHVEPRQRVEGAIGDLRGGGQPPAEGEAAYQRQRLKVGALQVATHAEQLRR